MTDRLRYRPDLDNEEHATVLAALRVYQAVRDDASTRGCPIPDTSDFFEGLHELCDDEIDNLCERINCCDTVPDEGSVK